MLEANPNALDDSSGSEGFCDQEPTSRSLANVKRVQPYGSEQDSDSSDEGIKVITAITS